MTQSMFMTLYPNLREHNEKFFNYFRMSIQSFDDLLEIIKEDLSPSQNYVVRDVVSAEEKLVITLRYLATGCYFADLHYAYRLGKSTIIEIVQKTCVVIWKKLKNIVMKEPTKEKWKEIAEGFEKFTNFPNCIGAIDGKHIRIIKPVESGSLFYNYKNFHSTVLLAICDANYCFISVDIGAYGKSNDSSIFKNSRFYERLMNNELNIPDPKPLSERDQTPSPYVIVGDEAFALMKNVMRPYCGKSLTHKKRIFNYRLSRARRYIECCFGILVNKWRIFHRPLNVNIEFSEDIIKACCVLHNYVRLRDGYRFDHILYNTSLNSVQGDTARPSVSSRNTRDRFADYFVNEGQLPWQNQMI
ncbi:protein ALP1-like [Coccinella septempunctata]|uniref:protein ALP1-like n=1 Tax=Coccinella septempunctata TaxID=41139 RepID=UPI001D0836FA|nr:protein ALP1-like [Coccinella septempunctata]